MKKQTWKTPYKTKIKKYKKNEFCKKMKCIYLDENNCVLLNRQMKHCPFTAKEFHKWLKNNDYQIIKK